MFLKRKNGFTLIEVMVSLAIVGIIGVMLTGIISSTIKARSISQERLHILALCTSSIDEIKSNQSTFYSINGFDAWLQANGYIKQAGYYKRNDPNTGITIEVYLSQNLNLDGLYQIKLVGRSSKVSELSIATVIKGGH